MSALPAPEQGDGTPGPAPKPRTQGPRAKTGSPQTGAAKTTARTRKVRSVPAPDATPPTGLTSPTGLTPPGAPPSPESTFQRSEVQQSEPVEPVELPPATITDELRGAVPSWRIDVRDEPLYLETVRDLGVPGLDDTDAGAREPGTNQVISGEVIG